MSLHIHKGSRMNRGMSRGHTAAEGFALMLSSVFPGNTSRKVGMERAQEANNPSIGYHPSHPPQSPATLESRNHRMV